MKQTGIKTFGDIELKDFTWWIKGVTYDHTESKAHIEVHAKESHHTVSRTFEFDCKDEWTSADAMNALLALDTFKGSK